MAPSRPDEHEADRPAAAAGLARASGRCGAGSSRRGPRGHIHRRCSSGTCWLRLAAPLHAADDEHGDRAEHDAPSRAGRAATGTTTSRRSASSGRRRRAHEVVTSGPPSVGLPTALVERDVETEVLDPVLEPEHPEPVDQQPGVEQGEHDHPEHQREQHQPVDLRVEAADRRALVERAPPGGGVVADDRGRPEQEPDDRGEAGPAVTLDGQPAHGQVAEHEHEQEGGGGEAGVPGPVHAPGDPAPEHPGDERGAEQHGAELGRGVGGRRPTTRSASRGRRCCRPR